MRALAATHLARSLLLLSCIMSAYLDTDRREIVAIFLLMQRNSEQRT